MGTGVDFPPDQFGRSGFAKENGFGRADSQASLGTKLVGR
jgi:hypothetical protein